jgi:hypothetical protein
MAGKSLSDMPATMGFSITMFDYQRISMEYNTHIFPMICVVFLMWFYGTVLPSHPSHPHGLFLGFTLMNWNESNDHFA